MRRPRSPTSTSIRRTADAVGESLLAAAADHARASSTSRIVLSSADSGSGRLDQWYVRAGFRQSGTDARGFGTFEAPVERIASARSVVRRIQRMEAERPPPPKQGSDIDRLQKLLRTIYEIVDELGEAGLQLVIEWIKAASSDVDAWTTAIEQNIEGYRPDVPGFLIELTAATDAELVSLADVLAELRLQCQAARGAGTAGSGALVDWQAALFAANQRASMALSALSAKSNREASKKLPAPRKNNSKRPPGLAKIQKLLAVYVDAFGLTDEWNFGAEWEQPKFARIAQSFMHLLADLAEAAVADQATLHWLVQSNFIDILLSWEATFCHNIVVKQLLQALK